MGTEQGFSSELLTETSKMFFPKKVELVLACFTVLANFHFSDL